MYPHNVITMTDAFAQIVEEAREEAGLTWIEVADRSGLSVSTVKRIAKKAGRSRKTAPPDVEEIAQLAAAFRANGYAWFREAERRVKASNSLS